MKLEKRNTKLVVATILMISASVICLCATGIPQVTGQGIVTGCSTLNAGLFPFEIRGDRFYKDGKPAFLNIICYQPLEPGQDITGEIREKRIQDDLRRWRSFRGGSDPVVIRVYAQPTPENPNRMPKIFYDGIRNLDFWIIRDIYFDADYHKSNAIEEGHAKIDAVIEEVNQARAFDRIISLEIGNEFTVLSGDVQGLKNFICDMSSYIKNRVRTVAGESVSNWVDWASWYPNDPLRTLGAPVEPNCTTVDFYSYNVYSYDPERIRDHQAGPITQTPFAGYLLALKQRCRGKPLVISETGLADSNSANGSDQIRLHPWYPEYRFGGLSEKQVAEGLEQRYWDARLMRDPNDANLVIAGIGIFEWNDEWHKAGNPAQQNDHPEEHFGLCRFIERPGTGSYQARYKLQQEIIHILFTRKFDEQASIIQNITADNNILPTDGNTTVRVTLREGVSQPVRYRWYASRGYVFGDSNNVLFYSGDKFFGPAVVTIIAADSNSHIEIASTPISIQTSEPGGIEILTLGTSIASGRVFNVDLDNYKPAFYIQTNQMYIQPFTDMKSIWIQPNGYWWTDIYNYSGGKLICWLVPKTFEPSNQLPPDSPPPMGTIASAAMIVINDADNDLLPDTWEPQISQDRYDDPDKDGANNLEEFLAGTSPLNNNDNDRDADNLLDNWELHFFGDTTIFTSGDDPDGDGLNNLEELERALSPACTAMDKDEDNLPDNWEIRWFGSTTCEPLADPDGDCLNNITEYELGLNPKECESDLNCDCKTDFVDFGLFAASWDHTGCGEPDWCNHADLDKNGTVNMADLYILTENWVNRLW